eukprot:gene14085-20037_t
MIPDIARASATSYFVTQATRKINSSKSASDAKQALSDVVSALHGSVPSGVNPAPDLGQILAQLLEVEGRYTTLAHVFWLGFTPLSDVLLSVVASDWLVCFQAQEQESLFDSIYDCCPAPCMLSAIVNHLAQVSVIDSTARSSGHAFVTAVASDEAAQMLIHRFGPRHGNSRSSSSSRSPLDPKIGILDSSCSANCGVLELAAYMAAVQWSQVRARREAIHCGTSTSAPASHNRDNSSTLRSHISGENVVEDVQPTAYVTSAHSISAAAQSLGLILPPAMICQAPEGSNAQRKLPELVMLQPDHLASLLVSIPDRLAFNKQLPELSHVPFYVHVLSQLLGAVQQPGHASRRVSETMQAARLACSLIERLCRRGYTNVVADVIVADANNIMGALSSSAIAGDVHGGPSPINGGPSPVNVEGKHVPSRSRSALALKLVLSQLAASDWLGLEKLLEAVLSRLAVQGGYRSPQPDDEFPAAVQVSGYDVGRAPGLAESTARSNSNSNVSASTSGRQVSWPSHALSIAQMLLGGPLGALANRPAAHFLLTEQLVMHKSLPTASVLLLLDLLQAEAAPSSYSNSATMGSATPELATLYAIHEDEAELASAGGEELSGNADLSPSTPPVPSPASLAASVARLWGDSSAVTKMRLPLQAYLAHVLCVLLARLSKQEVELTPGLLPAIMAGVSARLGNPVQGIRRQSMRVGRAFSKCIDPSGEALFGDQGDLGRVGEELWPGARAHVQLGPPSVCVSSPSDKPKQATSPTSERLTLNPDDEDPDEELTSWGHGHGLGWGQQAGSTVAWGAGGGGDGDGGEESLVGSRSSGEAPGQQAGGPRRLQPTF